jgi:hypothetical protein
VVSSQSSAATSVITGADVAGVGGFSGRESQVTASWLAQRVASGKIRWILVGSGGGTGGPAGMQSSSSVVQSYAKAHGTVVKGVSSTAGTLYEVSAN